MATWRQSVRDVGGASPRWIARSSARLPARAGAPPPCRAQRTSGPARKLARPAAKVALPAASVYRRTSFPRPNLHKERRLTEPLPSFHGHGASALGGHARLLLVPTEKAPCAR